MTNNETTNDFDSPAPYRATVRGGGHPEAVVCYAWFADGKHELGKHAIAKLNQRQRDEAELAACLFIAALNSVPVTA